MILLVRQFQATCMLAWMPNYYVQCSGRNCGIVLAEIMERILTAPYCASHVILLQHRTPSHSYGIVTGMFWECFRNPIYMHLCQKNV